MADEPITDLKHHLSQALLGHSYDPSNYSQERWLIEHLVEQVRNLEVGDATEEEVRATFATHDLGDFSFDRWLSRMVDEGYYGPAPETQT